MAFLFLVGVWYLCWIWDPWWWAGAGPQWTEGQILSISLGRRIWLPVPLFKNIDLLFRRRMAKILWFLFLLFREAAEEITALGGRLGWVRSKGLSALEIHGVCECISFWPLTVERRPYLSSQGRRIYRIEAGGDPYWFSEQTSEGLVLSPTLEPRWVSSTTGHCLVTDDILVLGGFVRSSGPPTWRWGCNQPLD